MLSLPRLAAAKTWSWSPSAVKVETGAGGCQSPAQIEVGRKEAVALNKYYMMTDHSEVYQIAMGKFHYLHTYPTLIYLTASPTSTPQARLLQDGQVG